MAPMHHMQATNRPAGPQRGAVLFMALIFLLIMTLLGVFGMNTSRLENLMAGNNQFQATALSNAELTVRAGEARTEAILGATPFTEWNDAGDFYYDRTAESTDIIDPTARNWGFASNPYSLPDGSTGRYVIEYAGHESLPGEDVSFPSDCTAGACVFVFRISAQNETSRGARRTVQVVYVTDKGP